VADVTAVFGITNPQVHVTWQAYHPITMLGTNPTTGLFDLWGPGRVNLGVAHEVDRYGDDAGEEKILPAAGELAVSTSVIVGMPDSVVTTAPDPDAVPMVVAALELLAARPELLARPPAEVAAAVGLAGERFRVDDTSSHHADGTVERGVSIDPERTVLPAAALAEALALPDAKAVSVNREHDVWELQAGGTTRIAWKGLALDIGLSSPKDGDSPRPLGTLEVGFIRVERASQHEPGR
jgi:hypothetical protein